MKSQWNIRNLSPEEEVLANTLSHELGITLVVARLLVLRGVSTVEQGEQFLAPRIGGLHNPFLMKDMQQAVDRLEQAVEEGQRIMIYGDYDVDGTTAVAIVYRFLRDHICPYDKLRYYIPNRNDEGYGVSYQGIAEAERLGIDLIIVLDCGVKAVEEIAYAKERGIDFIVCDHHAPGKELPPAVAILDPLRSEDHYPDKYLSGCGVGFKLIQAFAQHRGMDFSLLLPYMELLALSVPADQVPIIGENRILVHYGLHQLNTKPSIGLFELIRSLGLKLGEVDCDSIIFKMGPKLNASGRMLNGSETVALLIAQDKYSARRYCGRLEDYNKMRREKDQEVTQQAMEQAASLPDIATRKVITLYDPSWHKGVLGIVAIRLAEYYHRPVIILTKSGSEITGSARSRNHFNLYKALEACQNCLTSFGGHKYASGLTMEPDQLEPFVNQLESYVQANGEKLTMNPEIDIDLSISLQDISPKMLQELGQLAPFGVKNAPPVFVSHELRDAGGSRLVGRSMNHLQMQVIDPTTVRPLNAIALGQAYAIDMVLSGASFSLCYNLVENRHYGKEFIQMQVKDIHE